MDIETALQYVDELMARESASEVDILRQASRHILLAGGKRLRPRLLFLAYQVVGSSDLKSVAPPAAALEMLHTATLAHDDINDHGVLRRDRPTLNAIWGRTFALLTGDFLFAKVYHMLAPYGVEANTLLAEAAVQVVEGETLQAHAAKSGKLDEATYYRIIGLKTAALFQAAAKLGALLGKGTPRAMDLLGSYAFNIGLAFQIIDDILDLMADSAQLGKSAGLDMAQGKGVAVAVGEHHHEENGAVVAVADARDPLLAFKEKLLTGDTIARARDHAHRLVKQAVNTLGDLAPSPARDELEALAWATVERER